DAHRLQLLDLGAEARGIDDHAVADVAPRARVENAGGHQVEHQRLAAMNHAVAGVGPALVASHRVGFGAQRVDDLALAFVTPLSPHHHRARHVLPPNAKRPQAWTAASASIMRSTASWPARCWASRVEAPRCGTARTLDIASSGCSPGGSLAKTSRIAPRSRRSRNAAASATSSTTPPRAQLISRASRFMRSSSPAPIRSRVSDVSGTWMDTTSASIS